MKPFHTFVLLILGLSLFVVGSETALKIEQQRNVDYANPIYIANVLVATLGLAFSFVLLISMVKDAEKKVKKRKRKHC